MLPSSQNDPRPSSLNRAMYADTGIPLLLAELQKLGANPRRLVAHMAGGGQILQSHTALNIGKRNQVAAKNLLWKAGILVQSESLGGSTTRSMGLNLGTGQVWLKLTEGSKTTIAALGETHGLSRIGG